MIDVVGWRLRTPARSLVADVPPMRLEHPLADVLLAAARGNPPPADGRIDVWPQPPGRVAAVCGFTGHFVVAAGVEPGWVRARLCDGDFIAPMSPAFLDALAREIGLAPGSHDVVLVARRAPAEVPGPRSPVLVPLDAADHPRVERARAFRDEVRVWGTEDGAAVVILGRGLCGRWEASFEVAPDRRGEGLGRAMAAAAIRLVPEGEPVFVQTAPGNAASLRAILAAGYAPIGSEVLFCTVPDR